MLKHVNLFVSLLQRALNLLRYSLPLLGVGRASVLCFGVCLHLQSVGKGVRLLLYSIRFPLRTSYI